MKRAASVAARLLMPLLAPRSQRARAPDGDGRLPERPTWCTFLVCNRCNATCGMCDSWKLPRGRELSPREVFRVFEKLGPLDVVRLSGGEPFLCEDLLELAEAVMAASDPYVLHVTTNGSFPDRVAALARGFSRPERLQVLVSLDGEAAEHDRNRGRAARFSRAVETVRRLVEERPRGVTVAVNHTVISPRSLDDHDTLRRRFERLGVEVQTVLAYADTAMYGAERRGSRAEDLLTGEFPLHPALKDADVVRFTREELGRARRGSWSRRLVKSYYLEGLLRRLRAEPAPSPPCAALRRHVRLLPDGTVPTCQFNTEAVGNLLSESFESVWYEPRTAARRAWVDACKGCWAECEVVPNALYSGALLRDRLRGSPAGDLRRGLSS